MAKIVTLGELMLRLSTDNNERFVQKAPQNLVLEERAKLEKNTKLLEKLTITLKELEK